MKPKSHLSRLVEEAVAGEAFIIAKAGKPMVQVTMIPPDPKRRIGFLEGKAKVPDDFDIVMKEEIEEMFYDWPITSDDHEKSSK